MGDLSLVSIGWIFINPWIRTKVKSKIAAIHTMSNGDVQMPFGLIVTLASCHLGLSPPLLTPSCLYCHFWCDTFLSSPTIKTIRHGKLEKTFEWVKFNQMEFHTLYIAVKQRGTQEFILKILYLYLYLYLCLCLYLYLCLYLSRQQ